MPDLSYSDSSSSEQKKKKTFTVNYILSLNIWLDWYCSPRPQAYKTALSDRYSKDSELISQELAKGQSWRYAFFGSVQVWTMKLAELTNTLFYKAFE